MAVIRQHRSETPTKRTSLPRGTGRVRVNARRHAMVEFVERIQSQSANFGPDQEAAARQLVDELKVARSASFIDKYRIKT